MGSSSKRKSSKKKGSKLSSQAPKIKKTRRNKSRKHSRRHDSGSEDSMSSCSVSSPGNDSYCSNSDDDSKSFTSVSTYGSKDTYRRRKHVSRSRGHVKKRRKRARRRSSSSEGTRDLSPVKKRKRSKKSGDSKSRKIAQRKKLRRVGRTSARSDSRSCSTCNGDGSDSESEPERFRRRSRESKNKTGDLPAGKARSKVSSYRSPSHSSYSRYRDESGSVSLSEETVMGANNSRRLRSVIIFTERPESCTREENEFDNDMQKEEIVCDRDDYPSRTSSGEGNKKMSAPRSPDAFNGVKPVENVEFVSNHGVTEPSEKGNDALEHCDRFSDEFDINNSVRESGSDIHFPDLGSSGNDLEAILKQKALENLKKFRGGLKCNIKPTAIQKDKDNDGVNSSSSFKAEIDERKLPLQASSMEVEIDFSNGGHTGKVFGTAKQNPDHPPDERLVPSESSNMDSPAIGQSVVDKSVMGHLSYKKTSLLMDCIEKQTTSSVVSADESLMETEKNLTKTESKMGQSVSPRISTNQAAACRSAERQPAAAEQDETKVGSQYQQKTMSVMKDGEMVQVNYKVYIPKRAPALARRQLNR